jgi:hypothetical protein
MTLGRGKRRGAFVEQTHVVSDSQVIQVTPADGRPRSSTTLNRLVTRFFTDGAQQEAEGRYIETPEVRLRSLDRVPRRRWPMLVASLLLIAAAGSGAWWVGLRPPEAWQTSEIWLRLHLPKLPPPPLAALSSSGAPATLK